MAARRDCHHQLSQKDEPHDVPIRLLTSTTAFTGIVAGALLGAALILAACDGGGSSSPTAMPDPVDPMAPVQPDVSFSRANLAGEDLLHRWDLANRRSRLKRFRPDPRLQTVRSATIPLHSRDHFRLCENLNSAHHGETHLPLPKKR